MTSPRTRDPSAGAARTAASAIWRAAWFIGLWLVLAGAHLADLPAAAAAVILATWASLKLLQPGGASISIPAVIGLALNFFSQSVVAGVDVARRALDPRMPLRLGFVSYPIGFAPGAARNIFTTLTSLLPGAVPVADRGRELVYHCLDLEQPIASQLAAAEAELSRTFADPAGSR
jgi:multicomponent Na+:H+ antiporter subunit E